MSKAPFKLIGYAVSAAIGVAGGYFIGYRRATKKAMRDDMEFRQSLIEADNSVRNTLYTADCCEPSAPDLDQQPKTPTTTVKTSGQSFIGEARMEDYTRYSEKYSNAKETEDDIHEIESEEYGSNPIYEQQHLTLYADDILVDDYGEIFDPDDYDNSVGREFKSYLDKSKDGYCWVRNKRTLIEYEIERDTEPYYSGNGAVEYEGV